MAVEPKREPFVIDPRTVKTEGSSIVAASIDGQNTYKFVINAAKLETVNTFQSRAIFNAAQAGTGGLAVLRTEAEGALERYRGRRLDPKNDVLVLGVLVKRQEEGGFIFNPRGIDVWGRTPPW